MTNLFLLLKMVTVRTDTRASLQICIKISIYSGGCLTRYGFEFSLEPPGIFSDANGVSVICFLVTRLFYIRVKLFIWVSGPVFSHPDPIYVDLDLNSLKG